MKTFPSFTIAVISLAFGCQYQNTPLPVPPPTATICPPCEALRAQELEQMLDSANFMALLDADIVQKGICQSPELADMCRSKGNDFLENSDYKTARYLFLLGQKFNGGQPGELLQRLYCNIGLTYYDSEEYYPALAYFDSALIVESDKPYFFRAMLRKGETYLELHQPNTAKYSLEKALEIANKLKIDDETRSKFLAQTYQALSKYERRVQHFSQAIKFGELGIEKSRGIDMDALAGCLHNTGTTWQDSMLYCGNNENLRHQLGVKAISYTREALGIFSTYEEKGRAVRDLGALHNRLGEPHVARKILSDGIGDLQKAGRNQSINTLLSQLYLNRGEAFLDEKKFAQAASDFESAMAFLVPGYIPGQDRLPALSGAIASPATLMELLGEIADLQVRQYDHTGKKDEALLKKAEAVYDSLLLVADHTRGGFLTDADKINLAQYVRKYIGNALRVCARLHQITPDKKYTEKAFRLSEQGKSLVLLESVRLKGAIDSLLSPELRKEESRLRQALAEVNKDIFKNSDNPSLLAELTEKRRKNLTAWEQFQNKLKTEAKAYYRLKFAGADLPPEQLRRDLLAENQGLLEYFAADTTLYIFLATPDSLFMEVVTIDQKGLDANLDTLYKSMNSGEDETSFCRYSYNLYRHLLPQKILDVLPKRLIIIPDKPFASLPFEMLWTSASLSNAYDRDGLQNYLLANHDISYCYSANVLWQMRASENKDPKKKQISLAAFAPGISKEIEDG
ncbi:MAG TPA: hypothetical protein PK228_01950, partial [Saprospiraceae bacterium]|nr:hypothetical protein [Saprospiraceae bacterium]